MNDEIRNSEIESYNLRIRYAYHLYKAGIHDKSYHNNKGLAEFASQIGDLDLAERCFLRAIDNADALGKSTDKSISLLQLATKVYIVWGRYEEAIQSLDKAIAINPKYAEAWYNKALVNVRTGNKQKASEDLERALKIDYGRYLGMATEDEQMRDLVRRPGMDPMDVLLRWKTRPSEPIRTSRGTTRDLTRYMDLIKKLNGPKVIDSIATFKDLAPRILNIISGSKFSLLLVSLIAISTVIDSQFIGLLGAPGNFHFLLFVSLVLFASSINIAFILFAKSNDTEARRSRPLLFRTAYICTFGAQVAVLLIMYLVILEMLIFHAYDRIFLLLVVIVSHLLSAFLLGTLSVIFLQWLRLHRSLSILTYASVFIAIVFVILITLPLLVITHSTQSTLQANSISSHQVLGYYTPSYNISFVYGLGTYALPIMAIASWMLHVSLLKGYTNRIGKKKFWFLVSIPLAYQIFVVTVSNPSLVTNHNLVQIIYSPQIQFLVAINGQISGLFFAVTLWTFARKTRQKNMKNFFVISSLGIVSLFSSIQLGSPFYEAYPPFGLATLSFLGLSAYMLLVGMVGSASYVARDKAVRQELYDSLEADSHVLKMGTAEMQRELEHRVLSVTRKIKSGEIEFTSDPDEKDVRLMLEEILKEIYSKDRHPKKNNL